MMDIVLVDTSVWINFFKGSETQASLFLKNNLSNIIIATCPIVVQEVLQGIIHDKEFKSVNADLNNLLKLNDDPYRVSLIAASLYRELRKKGITIRKSNDCLIAAYAIKNDIKLLHDDRDFTFIEENSGLKSIV